MQKYLNVKSMEKIIINVVDEWKRSSIAIKLLLIFCALTAFSSPMPQHITWFETIIAIGIFSSALVLAKSVLVKARAISFIKLCVAIASILIFVPAIVATLFHNSWMNVARDLLPSAFFLIIPICLFVQASSRTESNIFNLLAITLIFIGISEAFVFYIGLYRLIGNPVDIMYMITSGIQEVDAASVLNSENVVDTMSSFSQSMVLYQEKLADAFIRLYDPAVFFASITMSCAGLKLILWSWRSWFFGVVLLIIGMSIAFGFLILGLRANVVLYLIVISIYAAYHLKSPSFYLRVLPVLTLLILIVAPWVVDGISLLFLKQQTMGTNGKAGEWFAVIKQISTSFEEFLFGIGWGGTFYNPILNYPTRFTHSMVSFYLLKTGVVGVAALFLYVLVSVRVGITSAQVNDPDLRRIYVLATIPPLLIGLLFQPSYKILSFALVFTLFAFVAPSKKLKLTS